VANGGGDAEWLEDGRILYRLPDPPSFWVIDPITKERRQVDAPAALRLVLSPDSRRAYLVQQDRESDIWILQLQ
jgi:hypothetical protein